MKISQFFRTRKVDIDVEPVVKSALLAQNTILENKFRELKSVLTVISENREDIKRAMDKVTSDIEDMIYDVRIMSEILKKKNE